MHYQNKVKEFMTTFGQHCPSKPTIPDVSTMTLRVKLLLEEVLELAEASGLDVKDTSGTNITPDSVKNGTVSIVKSVEKKPDIFEVADAIADISYVNYGAANAFGINIQPVENEVHASNMTKLFTEEEVIAIEDSTDANEYQIIKIKDNNNDACDHLSFRGYVVQNSVGKVQKSPSYEKADIEKVLLSQIIKSDY
jgi:predicted HAD superfamily Cof-like phosphohydrolase